MFSPLFSYQDNFRLLKSDKDRVVIEYIPGRFRAISFFENGIKYTIPGFDDCGYAPRSGYPQLPVRSKLIGIPINADIKLRIIDSNSDRIPDVNVPPYSYLLREYIKNKEIYNLNNNFPSSPAEIEFIGFMRQNRVAKLKFSPALWNPESKILTKYSRIVIEIQFVYKTGKIIESMNVPYFKELENVILNYREAYRWIKPLVKSFVLSKDIQSKGTWLKIYIKEDGIYRIDRSTLSSHGIDPGNLDPRMIRMFNNGGRELPRNLKEKRPAGLKEIAIYVKGEEDGKFDDSDYILFYGKSVNNWEIDKYNGEIKHYINHYTDKNVYWLTIDSGKKGKRVKIISSLQGQPIFKPDSYRFRFHREEEKYNIFHSGLEWYGRIFIGKDEFETKFNIKNAVLTDTTEFKFMFKGGSGGYLDAHKFDLFVNGKYIGSSGNFYGYNAKKVVFRSVDVLKEGDNNLKFVYSGSRNTSQAYLDWFEIEYSRTFKAESNMIRFESPNDFSGFVEYSISGFNKKNIFTFDITRNDSIIMLEATSFKNNVLVVRDKIEKNEKKFYISLDISRTLKPEFIEKDVNSNLRSNSNSADFIIITHNDFIDEVYSLKEFKESLSDDYLETDIINITDVYDEFSGGLMDPTAIRDFLKYAYENWKKAPRYVLLFGDGDYDYRNLKGKNDKNWIPPFEIESNDPIITRTTDDWYTYIAGDDRIMDLSIGRIPVQNRDEAKNVIEKIIDYEKKNNLGKWRNIITFVADDEYSNYDNNESIHTYDTEDLANNYTPLGFNRRKIYLMEYKGVKNPSMAGIDKPDAAKDLINQINEGTLLVNFIGHGAPYQLANERVIYFERDFSRIQNEGKYPLWVSASCDFAFFDNPDFQSMAEELINAEKRGAIAVLSSTRLAYAVPNAAFNKAFFRCLFKNDNRTPRIGDAIRYSKQETGSIVNNEKYVILGDPTMRLGIPELMINVNYLKPDSFKALGKVTVRGELMDSTRVKKAVDGRLFIDVFDTERRSSHRMPNGVEVNYILPGNKLFKGISILRDGNFEANFIVPKDITYGGKNGRISFYFQSEDKQNEKIDGNGYIDGIYTGGTSETQEDNEGPVIEVGLKNKTFTSDGFTSPNPLFLIKISDENGINITGEIGHSITIMFDNNQETIEDITGLFIYDEGSFTEGSIEYQAKNLSTGKHELEVKAWDNFNNSSTEYVNFEVIKENVLTIKDVFNYPNPFAEETVFTFRISEASEVKIKIYTSNGRLIKEITGNIAENGYNTIQWNGLDNDGNRLANGVYFYKIIAKSIESNLRGEAIGKLVIMK